MCNLAEIQTDMLTLIIQRRNIVFFLKSRPFLRQMEARKKIRAPGGIRTHRDPVGCSNH